MSEQLTHTIRDALVRSAESELHDPTSPYYDPTLTVEYAEAGMVRQYSNTPGITDEHARANDQLEEAWAVLSRFVSGTDAAKSLSTTESIGQTLAEMDEADGITPDPDWKRSGEGYLRSLVLPATARFPDRHGLGSASLHFYRDISPIATARVDDIDESVQFFPVVSWSEASQDGVIGQTLSRIHGTDQTRNMIGFAQVYIPVSLRKVPARRVNGRIIDGHFDGSLFPVNPDNSASGNWESGAEMEGIVRIYHDTETLESDIRTVRNAVTVIRTSHANSARQDDTVPNYEEPRSPRTP